MRKITNTLVVAVLVFLTSPFAFLFFLHSFREISVDKERLYRRLEQLNSQLTYVKTTTPVLGTTDIKNDGNFSYKPISGQLILSKAEVYFDSNNHGQLTLSSVSPIVYQTTKKEQDCGSSEMGLNNYSGNFCLEFQGNNFDLGELSFSDGTPHDGQLRLYKLDTTSDRDFIAIFQYGSCNVDYLSLYGLGDTGQLIQYPFKYKNGVIRKTIPVERWSLPEVPKDKILVTTWYDNTVENSGQKTASWEFDDSKNSFDEV